MPNRNLLTEKELEIMKFLTEGLSNKEVGVKLSIKEDTVKKHVSNILRKLDLRDRTQIAVFAVKNKID